MDAVLPAPLTHPTTTNASATWLDVLMRWLRSAALSEGERELLRQTEEAAKLIGAPLLQASNLEDLQARLDVTIFSPEFGHFAALASRRLTIDAIGTIAAQRDDVVGLMASVIGMTPARIVAATGPIVAAVGSAIAQIVAREGLTALDVPENCTDELRRVVDDPNVPWAIRSALRSSLRAPAAFLGLAHALLSDTHPEPWLAHALAETYRSEMREYLRLLALTAHVPEAVLPAAERFDVAAIVRDMKFAASADRVFANHGALLEKLAR